MNKHILSEIPAPKLDNLIFQADRNNNTLDSKTKELVYELFRKIKAIAACGDDERRELWLVVDRGAIEDYGNYEESLEEGEVENRKEFEDLWLDYYPEPLKWYKLITIIHSDDKYRTVFLDGKQIIELDERPMDYRPSPEKHYAADHTILINWLLSAVDSCIETLKNGTYNDFVSQNLPHKKRVGKILDEDCWRIFPK